MAAREDRESYVDVCSVCNEPVKRNESRPMFFGGKYGGQECTACRKARYPREWNARRKGVMEAIQIGRAFKADRHLGHARGVRFLSRGVHSQGWGSILKARSARPQLLGQTLGHECQYPKKPN